MSEQSERDAVVAEAFTWIGTPWHHRARIKGAGCDCVQLPIACYMAAGLIGEVDRHYFQQWHLHRKEELYVQGVLEYAREIDPADVKPADLLVWKFNNTFSHGGIVISDDEIIHSWMHGHVGVIRTNRKQDSELNVRPVRAFTLWPRA